MSSATAGSTAALPWHSAPREHWGCRGTVPESLLVSISVVHAGIHAFFFFFFLNNVLSCCFLDKLLVPWWMGWVWSPCCRSSLRMWGCPLAEQQAQDDAGGRWQRPKGSRSLLAPFLCPLHHLSVGCAGPRARHVSDTAMGRCACQGARALGAMLQQLRVSGACA